MLIGYGVVLFYWLNDALTPNANNLQAQSLFFESMVFLSCGSVSGCALPLPELWKLHICSPLFIVNNQTKIFANIWFFTFCSLSLLFSISPF